MPITQTLASGLRVGNYILHERIGQGAFAEVWKAVHHERQQRVRAIKIAVDPQFRRQLATEGSLPELDHPNIVPIIDSDTRFADLPYIVMPYIAGGNLADLLVKHPNGLPEGRVEALLRGVLAGLAAAHASGVVHRDIKPQNVLLDESGQGLVSDFGLSASAAVPDSQRSIVQSTSISLAQGQVIAGTLAYMAPEVLEGRPASASADIYSVGILLFEMLAGRRPAGFELPSASRAELASGSFWDDLYRRACSPIAARFASAAAMLTAYDGRTERDRAGTSVRADDDDPAVARLAEFQQAIVHALADGAVSFEERDELREMRRKLRISFDDAQRLFEELRGRAAVPAHVGASSDALKQLFRSLPRHDRLHVAPDITPQKRENAVRSCQVPAAEIIVAVIDCTVFGSAKRAIVFGCQAMYWSGFAKPSPATLLLPEFPNRVFRETTGSGSVYLGHDQSIWETGVGAQRLLDILFAIQRLVRESQASSGGS